MTPDQARAAHLAYDRLHNYMSTGGMGHLSSEDELVELTYGNFLAAETLAGILAKLRGTTFDHVLNDLPERDEGYPPGPAAKYMWETAVHRLRHLHAHTWQRRPDTLHTYSLSTALRSSFNLVVASVIEVATETKTTSRQLAALLRDAAAAEMR